MRWVSGTVTVGTSGTEEKLSTDNSNVKDDDEILAIIFRARAGNTGKAYIREATNAAAAVGWELSPGESSPPLNFYALPILGAAGGGRMPTIKAESFYVDVATNGDIVDFVAMLR